MTIQPLYEMLINSANIRIVSLDQVKIKLKNSEIYSIVIKELEAKQTQFLQAKTRKRFQSYRYKH